MVHVQPLLCPVGSLQTAAQGCSPSTIYAPWCGHCQGLEPTYNKHAKHLCDADSLVIAKMDDNTNEHPKADGYPTLLFHLAGNKSTDLEKETNEMNKKEM